MPPPRRPAPPSLPIPPAGPAFRRSRTGTYLFGAVYVAMLIAGFEVGFRAGSPKPTPPAKTVLLAAAKTKSAEPETTPPPPEPGPKAELPKEEPKLPEAKEPERKPMPEPPPAKKPEQKPEPKPEPKKTEPMPKTGTEVTFAKVAPVFKDKCGVCHGGANAKGGLDLRSAKAAIAGGDNGEAVKPGDPDNSLLWQEIVEGKMPPKNKPKLTEDEKKLIKEWIAGGAK